MNSVKSGTALVFSRAIRRAIFSFAVIFPATIPVSAYAGDGHSAAVVKRGQFAGDLFVSGSTVDVDAAVAGDVLAAGGRVALAGSAGGDVFAIGGRVDIATRAGRNVVVGAGTVSVDGPVGSKLLAAGGRVRLSRGARIDRDAHLAGGSIDIAGSIQGDVVAAGGRIVLTGAIAGDFSTYGRSVIVGPGAVIGGNLTHYGPEAPAISPDAHIDGEIVHNARVSGLGESRLHPPSRGGRLAGFVLGFLVLGAALYLWAPRFVEATATALRAKPWRSLGWGFLAMFGLPLAALLLLISVVGIPLAIALIGIYLALMLMALAMFGFALSDWAAQRWWPTTTAARLPRLTLFAGALVATGLVGWIPGIGRFGIFLAVVAGLGASCLRLNRMMRRTPED